MSVQRRLALFLMVSLGVTPVISSHPTIAVPVLPALSTQPALEDSVQRATERKEDGWVTMETAGNAPLAAMPKGVSGDWLNTVLEDIHRSEYPMTMDQTLTPVRPTDADWMAESNEPDAEFGRSVSTAGDVNGDDYDDVIVGALEQRVVFVYHGSASGLSSSPDWMAQSDPSNAWRTLHVGAAGDVNGDGYDDIIVGDDQYAYERGAAFVWYGSATGLGDDGTPANADWMVVGDHSYANLGFSVGTAGDVNGDGYDDVIIGGYNHSTYVWYGSATGLSESSTPANADWMAEGVGDEVSFGGSVGTTGDVNGDGYDEVIVGSCQRSTGNGYEWAVFVWYGSATGLGDSGTPANADWMATFGQPVPWWDGESVGTAADVNGDGYDEVMVGAPYYGESFQGAAFVWYGSATGLGDSGNPANADWMAVGVQSVAYFGYSVGTAGDVGGDGYADVIVGAPAYGAGLEGAAYVFYGSSTGLLPLGWSAENDEGRMEFGFSTSTAGDVNGDGWADVIIGAPGYTNGEEDEGAAFVYHGGGAQSEPHFLLRVSGPAFAAPGQMADYAISYVNLLTGTVENAVLVLALPDAADHVDSTAGGLHWPERHQLFWKLGDLLPYASGTVLAQARYVWGLPDGAHDSVVAMLVGTNWGQEHLDVAPYLSYTPGEIPQVTSLMEADLEAERGAYPDLDLIYTEAISDGFIFGEISRLTLAAMEPLTQVMLVNFDQEMAMFLWRYKDQVLATTYGPTTYAVRTAREGFTADVQLETVDYWDSEAASPGRWLTPILVSEQTCELTRSQCLWNCLLNVLEGAMIGRIAAISDAITTVACVKWALAPGDEEAQQKCLLDVAGGIAGSIAPGSKEAYDVLACGDECADPATRDKHVCVKPKIVCQTGGLISAISDLLPPEYFNLSRSITYNCLPDCTYDWGKTYYCLAGEKCVKDKGCQPRCWKPSVSRLRTTGGPNVCHAVQDAGGACDSGGTTIGPARDPNAKYGVLGDILPGQLLTYTITCENKGSGSAFGVYVVDELNENLDDSTLAVYGDGGYSPSSRTLVWDIGELAPGGEPGSSSIISFTVSVRDGLPGGTVIVNEAVVHFPSVPEETPTNAIVNAVEPLAAIPQTVETTYARPVTFTLVGKDVSAAPLTYFVEEDPLYGELAGSPPDLAYTPMDGFTGSDRFRFKVSNGITESRPADVQIVVHPSMDDTVSPQVCWTQPGDGEVVTQVRATPFMTDTAGPAYAPYLVAKFSEALDPTTVTTATVHIVEAGERPVKITPGYSNRSNWLIIVIREPWRTAEYTVTLTTGLRDASGNPLAEDYAWSFGLIAAVSETQIYLPLVLKQTD